MKVITCHNISKAYGRNKVFHNFNLELESGKIYGLLGRNGAGKTTFLNLLTNRCLPQKGEITLFGHNIPEEGSVLQKTCYMSDYMKGFEGFRVGEILRKAERAYPDWDKKYAQEIMERFHISRRQVYGKISKGQMTCVGLIIAMASGCELVILDEIYSGLDALVRKDFYEILLEDYERTKRTFIISSHLIDEMDTLFTDIILLKDGELLIHDPYEKLIEQTYVITGRPELMGYLPDSLILDSEDAENMIRIIAFGKKCEQYFDTLRQKGANITNGSLQDLFVGMVSEED